MSIHRFIESSAAKRAPVALLAHRALDVGLDVGEEQHSLARARAESFGSKVLEHAEARLERLARVEVPAVLAGPEEGLAAGDVLDVRDVDAAGAQHVELGLAEVVADRADDADLVEERRGQREMHGGAAEHPLALAERGLDGIEGDGSDDGDGHGAAAG